MPQDDRASEAVEDGGAAYRCSADAALGLIDAHPGQLIIDFDETLYLRNSTEDFLDIARPGWLAKAALQLLDAAKPWRFTGGPAVRDNWRVGVIGLLFPWIWLLWKFQAPRLARASANAELLARLRGREQLLIASVGFRAIIAPLLRAMPGMGAVELLACRILPLRDRLAGKHDLIAHSHGAAFLRGSLVLTDSVTDAKLLAACAQPCLTTWPGARWQEALRGVYLPFEYLCRVKRPNSRYFWTSIIQEDYALWVLASLGAGIALGAHVMGLALLLVSFWAVYETGYVDNDRIAATFETDPKLSREFAGHSIATPALLPWVWAALSGYLGVAVLAESWRAPMGGLLCWAGVLLATFLCFRLFNRVDKRSRVWFHGLLQAARMGAFAAVLPVSLVGATALAAHFVAMWVPYLVYRFGSTATWPDLPVFTARLFCFVIFTGLLAMAVPFSAADLGIAAAFLAWNLLRARRELPTLVRQGQRIDGG